MAACTNTFQYQNPFKTIIKWGLIILVLAVIIQLCLHALKHGNGNEVMNCLDQNPLQKWEKMVENPFTGKIDKHVYCIYLTESGKFGIFEYVDCETGICRQVTAFIKDKFTKLEQVENYMKNGGSIRIK